MRPALNFSWRRQIKVGSPRIRKIKLKAGRRYDCAYYGECLTDAAKHFSRGLQCKKCGRYEHRPPSMVDELDGMIDLLKAVFGDQRLEILD